ncbi:MAG: carbamoyltransferase [Candidatus Scalindua sp.]
MTYILGINAYHPDTSVALIKDGKLIAAMEEERFKRIKHWIGFPDESIQKCLNIGGITYEQLDHVAIAGNPKANILRKILFVIKNRPTFDLVKNRFRNTNEVLSIEAEICKVFRVDKNKKNIKFHYVEHHPAHLSSTFFVSDFSKAATLAIDGCGDFVSISMALGEGNTIRLLQKTYYPHSLGMLYLTITQYLGFMKFGDEYKVMGLAPYGRSRYVNEIRKLVKLQRDGKFELNLKYFDHHLTGGNFEGNKGEPVSTPHFTKKLEELLGPARRPEGENLEKRHEDIAASLQVVYEECFFHLLNDLYNKTKCNNLCLAGGCAMNSVANGKIFDNTQFKDIFIQPASGDNGTSLGAAYYVWNQKLGGKHSFSMDNAFWGTEYQKKAMRDAVFSKFNENQEEFIVEEISDENKLCKKIAKIVSEGLVVGWFQGRMEWGARALGNRSIIADPRRPDMREIINTKIKFREKFRPFAPSIMEEDLGEYFEKDSPDPFMVKVYPVKKEKRNLIPAVTHVDGSGRLQTVNKVNNPLYYKLIKFFKEKTGVPVILNTSFNENEPIVNKPEEAINCFLRTSMDVLVIGNFVIKRKKLNPCSSQLKEPRNS